MPWRYQNLSYHKVRGLISIQHDRVDSVSCGRILDTALSQKRSLCVAFYSSRKQPKLPASNVDRDSHAPNMQWHGNHDNKTMATIHHWIHQLSRLSITAKGLVYSKHQLTWTPLTTPILFTFGACIPATLSTPIKASLFESSFVFYGKKLSFWAHCLPTHLCYSNRSPASCIGISI